MSSLKPLSIYIHIPFCIRKCLYCNFLSYSASDDEKHSYINALVSEIEQQSRFYDSHSIISVFIGGGTPSVLDASEIERVLCKLKESFHFNNEPEITIEVNPGTVTEEKMASYLRSGINRLSIGLQSADDEELKILGRIHDYVAFCDTYELARKVGFNNINVDLMSAIPGQTTDSYRATLEKILEYGPEHISAYSLILEEGTWFYENRDKLELLTEDEDRVLYEMTEKILSANGYHRYEISNYAKDGYECIHNKVYWQRGDYVGFGLGAASMVGDVRWNNTYEIDKYQMLFNKSDMLSYENNMLPNKNNTLLQENKHCLTKEEQMEEFMFLGLRLIKGVKKDDFREKFGVPIEDVYGEVIKKMQNDGLVIVDDSIRLTPYGIDISNYVMAQFLF
ncbi:MAG: oxygen-independent coproporphyrinogen III oxidase [Lachnospiraceae bacterium]|nr:oxygen-independent coproporphyrinogen III oxidase [Lachnospiraceae bacterium]